LQLGIFGQMKPARQETGMRPETETELSQMIRAAAGPLAVRGGGTRSPRAPGPVLDTGGLAGIRLYEPGALTLVAGAGTALAEVEAALAGAGQRLAFEPPDLRGLLGTAGDSSLGGVVATNASGPRRVQAGACRDHLLGVRFVDGTGAVVSNGGRVMKNVTGYDLVKLMAGARGGLGVLTEVSVKTLPAPETEATLVLPGLDPAAAVAAMSAALGSPWEVSGAAHLPDGRCALRLEGFAAAVAGRAVALAGRLDSYGPWTPVAADESAELWRSVRDVAPFHGRAGEVWRVICRPSAAADLALRAGGEVLTDWGGGLLWCLVPDGTDLRARLGAFAGHAVRVRAGGGPVADTPPEPPAVAALSAALRHQFDPRRLFRGQ